MRVAKARNARSRTRLKHLVFDHGVISVVGPAWRVCMATIATCRRSWSWGEAGFPGCIKLSINLSRYKRRGVHACSCRGTCICAISPVVNEDRQPRRVCACRSTRASSIHGVPVITASWRIIATIENIYLFTIIYYIYFIYYYALHLFYLLSYTIFISFIIIYHIYFIHHYILYLFYLSQRSFFFMRVI